MLNDVLFEFPLCMNYHDMDKATEDLTAELSSTDTSQRQNFNRISLGHHQKFRCKIRVHHYQKLFLDRDKMEHMYLENDMVDMLLLWMGRDIKWNDRTPVHFMNSYFYTRMKTGGVGNVSTWAQGVDLFTKTLVFIPICDGNHYSLCVVVNPGFINANNDGVSRRISCMLYFDPMGHGIPRETAALVRAWLNARWRGKYNTSTDEPFTEHTFQAYSPKGKCIHLLHHNNCT